LFLSEHNFIFNNSSNGHINPSYSETWNIRWLHVVIQYSIFIISILV